MDGNISSTSQPAVSVSAPAFPVSTAPDMSRTSASATVVASATGYDGCSQQLRKTAREALVTRELAPVEAPTAYMSRKSAQINSSNKSISNLKIPTKPNTNWSDLLPIELCQREHASEK
jgi:hypothetical protein